MGVNDRVDEAKHRKGKAKEDEAGWDAVFRGYLNVQLSEEEKEHYDEWAASASFEETLEGAVSAGVHVSLRYEVRSGGFLASGTQRREGTPNSGLVVTARARTASLALGRLLFTLAVLSHYERWEERQPMADPDRW